MENHRSDGGTVLSLRRHPDPVKPHLKPVVKAARNDLRSKATGSPVSANRSRRGPHAPTSAESLIT
jgi:hypothetical protein